MATDHFMVRPGGAELAKTVHSISGSITTVFLFTRLWARKQQRGLWWDDYILTLAWALQLIANGLAGSAPSYGFNIVSGTQRGQNLQFAASTVLYLALAASKSAFMITLLRLATTRSLRIMLWSLLVTFSAASTVMGIVTWLDLCEAPHDMIHASNGLCVTFSVLRWVHTGYAIFIVVIDIFLAWVPWCVISNVALPKQEKFGVGVSMSLVGLAGLACIARVVTMASLPATVPGAPPPDWTYGSVTILCISQGEVAIYIIAQVLPTIRVMLLGSYADSVVNSPAGSANRPKGSASGNGNVQENPEAVELVQLPTGRIVPATSEEGRSFEASRREVAGSQAHTTTAETGGAAQKDTKVSTPRSDDQVRRLWSDMRLSNKARSKSPASPPLQAHDWE